MTSWRRSWQRYRRQNRVLVGLYLGLLLLAGLGFALFSRMAGQPPEELTNRLLIFLLWWFDLTLIGVVFFILLRNLFKLALERHYGILGSRFRIKLLLSYVVLSLLPTGVLFVLGVSLLSQAATFWFSAPVEGMAAAAVQLADGLRRETELRAGHAADAVAARLQAIPSEAERVQELERLHRLIGSQLTAYFRGGEVVVELVDPRQRALQRLSAIDRHTLDFDGVRSERFAGTMVVRTWRRLPDGAVVLVGEALAPPLVQAQARLADSGAAYQKLKLERPTVTATVVLGFGGLALLVVFSSIWLGLYLSRRFTAPLLALAATTERIAGGDSLEEVPMPAEDEVGLLVSSFNAMVVRIRDREAALKSTVQRLDAVLGAVRTGVLTLDADRVTVYGNPAAAALLGMPELVRGAMAIEALAEAGHARLVETVRGAEGDRRGSLTLYPQGVARQVEVMVTPLGDPAEPEGWVVAIEDLTYLLRAQRLAAWSEVARRIAHQIKNPLTPIRLAAERIARKSERHAADLDEAIAQGSSAIVEHVQVMQEMVDAFARYAKLPPMNRRPVHIGELAVQVATLFHGVRAGVEVRGVDQTGGREVLLDPEQMRQVLTNLVDNAVEASGGAGVVEVSARLEGSDVLLEVTDEGEGLSVADPEVLFQPFFSTKGRGSGIGLALVQRIVSDHGGTVRLEPRTGRGVRAVVRVPAVAP